MIREDQRDTLPALVWVTIYREGPLTPATLRERMGAEAEALDRAVLELERDGSIQRDPSTGRLRSALVTIPVGARAGWEAAVLDHFQAVAKAIAAKLQLGAHSREADVIGGATLTFDVSDSHPLAPKVLGLLRGIRREVNDLWREVDEYNREHPPADPQLVQVTFYIGQSVQRASDPRPSDNPGSSANPVEPNGEVS